MSAEKARISTRWAMRTSSTRFRPTIADAFRADPSYYLQQVPNPFHGLIQTVPIYPVRRFPRWKLYVPFPQYSNGTAPGISSSFVPWANSIYNAAQFSVEKRFSQGLQFLFSYVFQKSLDDSSLGSSGYSFLIGGLATSEPNARDPNNLRLDRSLPSFSIPQIAQLSFRLSTAVRPRPEIWSKPESLWPTRPSEDGR